VQGADQQGCCCLREASCGRTGPGCREGYRPLEGGLVAEWQEQECGSIGPFVRCAGFLRPDVHRCVYAATCSRGLLSCAWAGLQG